MQYLRDNAGILESSADGTTWKEVFLNTGEPLKIGGLQLRDNAGTLEVSADNGATWELVGGGGGVTDHTLLTNIGTNTHAQIDTHVADTTQHFTQAQIDHVNILSRGTNTHAQLDAHVADTTKHFTQALIDHVNLLNRGTNTHAQIDTHVADTAIHGGGSSPAVVIVATVNATRNILAAECNGTIFVAAQSTIGFILPTAAIVGGFGHVVIVKTYSVGSVAVGPSGSDTILFPGDIASTIASTQQGASISLYCTGNVWFVGSKNGIWTETIPE